MTRAVLIVALLLVTLPAYAQDDEADQPIPPDDSVEDTEPAEPAVGAEPAPTTQRLTLLLDGNVDGYFADVDCRQGPQEQSLWWSRHAAYHKSLGELSAASGLPEPVALNTGNSVFPGVLGRYLATRDVDEARRLAEIIAQVPTKVHGAGNREFTIPRQGFVNFAEALQGQGIDVQAANLECPAFGGSEVLCDLVQTADDDRAFRIYERGGLRIAVTTVLSPDLLDRLIQEQRQGIELIDPLEVLPDLVERMREAADLVIVQFQAPSRSVMQGSRELASRVEGIDLVITSQSLDSTDDDGELSPLSSLESVIRASGTGTPVISADGGPAALINVDLNLVTAGRDDDRWTVRTAIPRRVDLSEMPIDPRTGKLLQESIEDFCDHWGEAIGDNANLAEPMELEDFQRFVLNVMRFSTGQEVALLNRRAFRKGPGFPLTGELTRADIYATMPFENRLVLAEVSGAVLQRVAGSLGEHLIGVGIDVVDGAVTINGRSVRPDRMYRVAVNDFLSQGGDRHFRPAELQNRTTFYPDWSVDPPTIDDVVIEFVANNRHLQRGPVDDALSPVGNFPDLHRKFLWTLTGSLNSSYNQVAVHNPVLDGQPGYDQSRLTVQSTDQINIESRFTANADSRSHGWNNDLNVQFARARVHDDDDEALFETTKDHIRFRSRYRYQGWRAAAQGRRYVPDPMVEGQVETEFQPPPTRDWHRLDLRGILGVSFQLFDPLELRVGANVRHEVNRPDALPTWGVNAGFTLARISPFDLLGRPLRFESELEYFYNDIALQNIHEGRTSNRIFFAVFEQFFFTTTFNAFLYRDDVVGELGTNTELTVGVNYSWELSRQTQ